jgi:hypothetical protein
MYLHIVFWPVGTPVMVPKYTTAIDINMQMKMPSTRCCQQTQPKTVAMHVAAAGP